MHFVIQTDSFSHKIRWVARFGLVIERTWRNPGDLTTVLALCLTHFIYLFTYYYFILFAQGRTYTQLYIQHAILREMLTQNCNIKSRNEQKVTITFI